MTSNDHIKYLLVSSAALLEYQGVEVQLQMYGRLHTTTTVNLLEEEIHGREVIMNKKCNEYAHMKK